MTDKSMFDILSKFDSAGTRTVTESAGATGSRSSSAGDPAMHDILSKFYGAVSEAGPADYPAYKGSDSDFDQPTDNPDVMATPSFNGYQATKNMKTGDTTQNYTNGAMRVSQSQNAQGDITRQSADYKMGDTKMSMAQAGNEQFADAEQFATGAGPGAYGSAYDAGDGNLQVTSIGQVGSMDQTATSVSSDASGNTNNYMSDRDTSNMIKQQEKDIARLQTDKLFNGLTAQDLMNAVQETYLDEGEHLDENALVRLGSLLAKSLAKVLRIGTGAGISTTADRVLVKDQPEEESKDGKINNKDWDEFGVKEDEHDTPASEQEAEMAGDQAEYIKYAIDEIKDSIEAGNSFPEWFQNKLSGVYTTLKDLHGYMEGDKRNDAEDEVVMSLEDVVSKKQAAADVVGKKTAVDDIVQELSKSYADFIAQVEEERDDMSFFKKDKKR